MAICMDACRKTRQTETWLAPKDVSESTLAAKLSRFSPKESYLLSAPNPWAHWSSSSSKWRCSVGDTYWSIRDSTCPT